MEKICLAACTVAFLFLTTPAWIPGFGAAAAAAAVLCLVIRKLPITGQRIRKLLAKPEMWVLGLVLTSAFGCNFYNTWADSHMLGKVSDLLGVERAAFVGILSVLGVLAATPAVSCALSYYIGAGNQDIRAAKARETGTGVGMKKALLILFVIYAVGISAILRANLYYQDDAGRAAYGYKDWDYFGRYLSTGLSTLVHMGNYLADAAPMPQLLAMLLMACSAVLLLYIVYDRTEFSLWELAAVVPLGLNPYFLECISFRFDAPYMAISILAAIVPLLYRRRSSAAYILASMLGTLGVCTSYQSATGIYPMLVILLALRMWNQGTEFRQMFRFCLRSAAGYGLGLLYFKLVIMKPADAGYVSNALPAAENLLGNALGNLKQYYTLVLTDFQAFWLGLIFLLVICFTVVSVWGSRRKKWAALAMTAAALGLMALLCFGIYPMLAATLFAPRAMYGFGVLIVLLGICTAEGAGRIPAKVPILVLSWAFFVFGFIYGNVLNLQEAYTEFRIGLVMEDLNDMEVFVSGDPVTVQLSGSIGQTPILDNMPKDGQILRRLVPETFAGGDDLTQYRFFCYYDLRNVRQDASVDLRAMELPILKDTMYHTIRGEGNQILIELK